MNWKLLGTMVTLIGVGASVALGQGTTPTIVQGDYISNVFGNSNFIKNPNAKLNNANVTVSNATVTRSTTTPLVATSEFNITTSTSTGYADWSTRTFDAGMKGQNCEARFTYRGFSVGSTTAQILQGANVVAQLTLTASTDPRIASINFPCGDLSSATTFRLQQATASLTGTNEIGGIYVGLATNMANVAQAETVVIANVNAQVTIAPNTYTNVPYQSESLDAYGEYNNTTGVFTAKRAGNYFVAASLFWFNSAWNSTNIYLNVYKNGSLIVENLRQISAGTSYYVQESSVSISLAVGDTLVVSAYQSDTANRFIASNSSFSRLSISRFPSSSELVVKPETQNVFGGVRYDRSTSSISVGSGAVAPTGFNTYSSSAWNTGKTYFGKCQATDVDANRIGCKIPAMPVGSYKITASGLFYEASANSGDIICSHAISETTTGTYISYTTNKINTASGGVMYNGRTITGIFQNTSVADRNFVMSANKTYDTSSGSVGNCQLFVSNSGGDQSNFNIVIEPLDQPSNSALYVQGPVLGAQTGAAIPSGYLGKVEFGGGNGSTSASPANVYTISNVTPGVYLVRGYAAAQATGARSATYAGYGCTITSNASLALNWYDFLNVPQTNFGASGGTFTGYALSNNYANSSASIMQIINVTSTSTYYVRCAIDSNGSGILLVAGAEFIRLN